MYGPIITEAPEGFVPREQWPEYNVVADLVPHLHPRLAGKNPIGVYRYVWPIVAEEYVSDKEPVLADSDPTGTALNRVIGWQRLFRTDIPKGWHTLSKKTKRLEGFFEFRSDEYWKQWSESSRRYRKKWNENYINKIYSIEKINFGEFKDAYRRSTIWSEVKDLFIENIKRKLISPAAEHIELWGVRNNSSGVIVAGLATLTSPTHRGSHYISGYVIKDAAIHPVMVGLMDNWFAISQKRGIRFLHFGGFWVPGNPKNWKGFSIFKAKFGLTYIACPPTLFRFIAGKLF